MTNDLSIMNIGGVSFFWRGTEVYHERIYR